MRPRLIAAIVLTLLLLFGAGMSLVLVMVVPFAPVMCLLAIVGAWIAAFPEGRSRWWYASVALPFLSLLVFWIAGSLRPGFF